MRKKKQKLKKALQGKTRDVSGRDDSVQIKMFNYEIIYEPLEDKYSSLESPELKKELAELYELSEEKPRQVIARLLKLKEQYPNIPRIYNYIARTYSILGETGKTLKIVYENYKKNPDYLFGRINYAEICLQNKEFDIIPEIFDNKFDLKLLYPERDKFHASEALGFFGITGIYFAEIGNLETAKRHLQIIEKLESKNYITKRLKSKILMAEKKSC